MKQPWFKVFFPFGHVGVRVDRALTDIPEPRTARRKILARLTFSSTAFTTVLPTGWPGQANVELSLFHVWNPLKVVFYMRQPSPKRVATDTKNTTCSEAVQAGAGTVLFKLKNPPHQSGNSTCVVRPKENVGSEKLWYWGSRPSLAEPGHAYNCLRAFFAASLPRAAV